MPKRPASSNKERYQPSRRAKVTSLKNYFRAVPASERLQPAPCLATSDEEFELSFCKREILDDLISSPAPYSEITPDVESPVGSSTASQLTFTDSPQLLVPKCEPDEEGAMQEVSEISPDIESLSGVPASQISTESQESSESDQSAESHGSTESDQLLGPNLESDESGPELEFNEAMLGLPVRNEDLNILGKSARLFIPIEPYHPSAEIIPPKTTPSRTVYFQQYWFEYFPWLTYDASLCAVLCHDCALAYSKGLMYLAKRANKAFMVVGFRNWKKAIERFRVHERSASHSHALDELELYAGRD